MVCRDARAGGGGVGMGGGGGGGGLSEFGCRVWAYFSGIFISRVVGNYR